MLDLKGVIPPPGVSRPLQSGGWIPLGKKGSSLAQAQMVIETTEGIREKVAAQSPPRSRKQASKPAVIPDTVPLANKRRGSSDPLAEVYSADGVSYTFPKESAGSKDPQAIMADVLRAVIVSLAEFAKGGDPNTVLKAFKVQIKDLNGQVFYDYKDAPTWSADRAVESLPVEDDEDEGYEGPDLGGIFAED